MSRWALGVSRRVGATLSGQGGAIMVVALLVAALLLAGVASAAALASGSNRAVPFWRDHGQAFYAAESGVDHCLWKLKNSGGTIVEATYPNDPPSFTSNSVETAGLLGKRDSYEVWVKTNPPGSPYRDVVAFGHSGSESYLLKCRLKQTDPLPFHDPDSPTGVITPDPTDITVTEPSLTNLGQLIVHNGETRHIGPGEFLYTSIILENSARLVLDGDTTLWVTTSIDLKNGSIANPYPEEHNLVIYMPPSTSQTIVVRNGAVLNAFVYAPNATADLKMNSVVNGLLVVASYTLHGTAKTYYSPVGEGIPWPSTATIDYSLLPDGYGD